MKSLQQSEGVYKSYRLAWIAYIRPVIVFLILSLPGVMILSYGYSLAGAIFFISTIIFMVLQMLSIRSVCFYTDTEGVQVSGGIFPWSKFTYGVRWCDIDKAAYFTGFWSWLFKSYTVCIRHRFSKSEGIILRNIARGHLAVNHINTFHQQFLARSGRLQN